jgi:hypothetical protein
MSNQLLTISDITNEGMMILENELVIADKVNREYDARFGIDGAKVGYTVNVRKPARFKGTMGPALNVEDFVESSVPVTLTNQFHVDTQFTTSDLMLSMDMFSKRVLAPKIKAIANRVDYDLSLAMSNAFFNVTGTPGTLPTTVDPFLQAGAWLNSEGARMGDERYMVLDQWTQSKMAGALTGLFNPQVTIGEQYKKGLLGKATLGFDFYTDQNIASHTFGALGGTPQYDSSQTSSALLTTGWADKGTLGTKGWSNTTAVVKVGDVFSIANVLAVNPQNRNIVGGGKARYFVVTIPTGNPANGTYAANLDPVSGQDVGGTYTSDGSGKLQLTVAMACISAGQFQNVNAAPVNSAALTFLAGANAVGPQNLAFERDAFCLVTADLPLPRGVDTAARASDEDVGLSIRIVTQYTIGNDALPSRADVLYGLAPLYRELGCRVTG